jgi:hypothetical protein
MNARRTAARAMLAVALTFSLGTALAAQDAVADPLPEPGTVLEAGRYVSDAVGPAIDFRVDEGWIVGPSGNGPIFTLEYLDAPGAVLSVTRFDGETFLDSCDPTSMSLVEATVPRLTEIIAGNPYLAAGTPAITEAGGYSGLQVDVGVPTYAPTECGLPYVLLWAVPIGGGGEFVQVANQQSRFLILDVGGDVIVIAIEAFPGVPFAGFLEAGMKLVDSMHLVPGAYVPPTPAPSLGPDASPAPEPSASPQPSMAPANDGSASA